MESLGVTDDPFVAAELPFSGDKQTDEMRKLLTALADDVEEDYEIWLEDQDEEKEPWAGKLITTTVVVEKARKIGVLIEVVGGPEEKQPLRLATCASSGGGLRSGAARRIYVAPRGGASALVSASRSTGRFTRLNGSMSFRSRLNLRGASGIFMPRSRAEIHLQ